MANIFSNILNEPSSNKIFSAGVKFGNLVSSLALIDLEIEPELNDVLMYLDIPSNAILHSLLFRNTKMEIIEDPGGMNDNALVIGFYAATKFKLDDLDNFEVNDPILPNFFGTSKTFFQLNTEVDGSEVRFSLTGTNDNTGIIASQDPLWMLAALPSDPHANLRIGAKISRAFGVFTPGITMVQAIFTGKN